MDRNRPQKRKIISNLMLALTKANAVRSRGGLILSLILKAIIVHVSNRFYYYHLFSKVCNVEEAKILAHSPPLVNVPPSLPIVK
jgi:hypothetical protein